MLDLAEELLLVALEDETGKVTPAASQSLEYGLAGAVLMEGVIGGRLDVEDGKLVVVDGSPTGDGVLDGALARIAASRRPRDAQHWVGKLGGEGLKGPLISELVEKGVLGQEERRVLWIIPQKRYPTRDSAPERGTRERVRAVLLGGASPEPRIAALVGLFKACDLVDEVFSWQEAEHARRRLDEITEEDLMSRAVSDTVAGVQAATQAAVMASITAATASSAASCSTSTSPSC